MSYFRLKMWYYWKKYILSLFKSEREPYHISNTTMNIDEVENVLIDIGYQPNYFSFDDKGQLTSMRIIYRTADNTWRQKHIRFFEDGEIRGHDELSYEEDAIAHKNGVTLQPLDEKEIKRIKEVLHGY